MVRCLRHAPSGRFVLRMRIPGEGVQDQQPGGHPSVHGRQHRCGALPVPRVLRHRCSAPRQGAVPQQDPGGGPYRRDRGLRRCDSRTPLRSETEAHGHRSQAARSGHVRSRRDREGGDVRRDVRASQGQDRARCQCDRHRRRVPEGRSAYPEEGRQGRTRYSTRGQPRPEGGGEGGEDTRPQSPFRYPDISGCGVGRVRGMQPRTHEEDPEDRCEGDPQVPRRGEQGQPPGDGLVLRRQGLPRSFRVGGGGGGQGRSHQHRYRVGVPGDVGIRETLRFRPRTRGSSGPRRHGIQGQRRHVRSSRQGLQVVLQGLQARSGDGYHRCGLPQGDGHR